MVTEPLGGRREIVVTDCHNSQEWAKVVGCLVEDWYVDAERITLVQDNLSAHRKAALYELFEPKRARTILAQIEYTPKHGS